VCIARDPAPSRRRSQTGLVTINTSALLGSQTGSGTASATVNITGGTFISNVDLVKGLGATTATLTLNGVTLDMKNNQIGPTALIDTLNFQSGTLQNVFEINSGAVLNKTTAGTLTLAGTNAYTGGTTLTLGTLRIGTGSSLGSVNSTLTVNAGTLDLNGNNLGVGSLAGAGGTIVNNVAGSKTLTIGNNNRDSKRILNFEIPAPISPSTESWPTRRGFDTHIGTIAGVGSYFDPWSLVHDLTPITPPNLKGFYYTDFITETACKTITDSANAKNPFFLYVAYTAPHWPMQARESDIARYADTYKVGWDELRQRRYRRLIELGIIKPSWPLSPRPTEAHGVTIRSWSDAPNKDWEARRMAVYAAMIDRMDQGIGRLIETLSANHLDDNTLVIFLSDNGGCAEVVQRNWYDIPTKTRDGRPIAVGNDPHVMPGDETTFQSVGPAWANASNTPFRRFKHFTEEGGISTPLIVRWPGKVDRAGALEPAVGHVIDLVPTCLEAASVSYPTSLKGRDLTPLAGMSLWPAIRGQPMSGRPLFWEHEGNRAVRVGPWKLLAAHQEPWQLYDLESDRTESHDLATEHPEKTAELRQLYDAWAHRIGVAPWPIKPATRPSTESLPLSPRAERQGEG